MKFKRLSKLEALEIMGRTAEGIKGEMQIRIMKLGKGDVDCAELTDKRESKVNTINKLHQAARAVGRRIECKSKNNYIAFCLTTKTPRTRRTNKEKGVVEYA